MLYISQNELLPDLQSTVMFYSTTYSTKLRYSFLHVPEVLLGAMIPVVKHFDALNGTSLLLGVV